MHLSKDGVIVVLPWRVEVLKDLDVLVGCDDVRRSALTEGHLGKLGRGQIDIFIEKSVSLQR